MILVDFFGPRSGAGAAGQGSGGQLAAGCALALQPGNCFSRTGSRERNRPPPAVRPLMLPQFRGRLIKITQPCPVLTANVVGGSHSTEELRSSLPGARSGPQHGGTA